jgi:hypothetical protein
MSAQIAQVERAAPRHIKVTGPGQTFRYERCEHADCVVTRKGVGSSCGWPACPSCGSGGANLTEFEFEFQCTCGASWIPDPAAPVRLRLALPAHAGR